MIFLAAVFILCASIKQHTISAVEDTACDCPSHLFSCGNCICIPKHWACDGDNDCGNHRDEASCDIIRRCPPGQFTCRNKRCIIKHWLCDDDNDCADDSDELDCPMRNCTKDEFQCDGVKCIPDKWRCDHDNDCEDSTDEKCDTKLSCNSKQFQCGNGLCIPKAWKCDKDIDCADGEDEKNCHKDELFCGMKEFQCLQAQKCIPLEKKCDWINDCGDFEDEIDCNFQPFNSHMTSCGRKEFKCGDGTCIRKDWQCDGDVDCNDQSDESNCTLPTCGKDEFTCLMGECIPGDKKCNGIFDCPDNSDEHNCTYSQSACGPSLFECDVKKCVHINDVCDGKDDCDDKTDETRCVLQDMLIYARRTYVERLFLDEGRSQIIPLMNIGHSIAIDFDPVEKRVYWSDGERHIIGSANLDGSDQKAILDKNISHPDGIAVDSVHRVIYWTDTGLNQISMANLDGTNRKTIINKDLDEPRDIAVDTVSGHIYWSDWGVKPRLERASLNGGDRFVIRNTSLKWPNGIGLDVKEKKLYWGDAHQNTIEEINFDGSGHKVLLTGVPHVFGTTVYGDSIYWTDLQTRTIERVNKNDIKDREVILEGLADLMDIKAVSVMRKMDLCLPVEYTCASGQCIMKSQHCDGNIDCLDATDEIGCINSAKVCGLDQFTCYNSKCISNQKKCNGKDDCGDDSDERNCSFPPASCSDNSGGCDHICEQLPMGVHCSCYHGFKLQSDLKSCIDVDECNWMGTCSQQCVNTNGSFHCTCVEGYVLKPDGRGCKAKGGKAYLIFANRVDIRKVLPDLTEYDSILKGLENAIALDFDIMQGYVYWSDVTLDKIMRAFMNGSGKEEVVQYGLQSPAGLAVDWIHNVLYWTDSGTSVIEVMDLERKLRKILIWENLERPRAIVTHPGHGLLFWTDWGTIAKIERSGMDGSNRLVLANTSLFWPNGLTLDYATNKLYWADAKHHVIECANLDGTSRRTVINQGLPHPFALTLFEDELYWTDWRTRSINKANKFTGNDVEIIHNRLHFPMDIHSFHPQRQPKMRKRCLGSHRGCSHFCLPSPGPKSWTCSCPNGQHLLPDLKTCTSDMDTFLLYTTKTGIRRVNMDSSTKGKEVVILLAKVVMPVGLDFDAKHNMIYWTDTATDTISRAKIDGSHEEVLINTSLDMPARITLDWIGRKLYWAYPKRGLIEVSNLDGSYRKVLLWAKPYDIIVDPITGYIFWSDWSTPPTIDRAGMDGQGHITIVMDQLKLPNSLALDYIEERLYWMDSDLSHIESSDYEGKNRKIIITVDTNQQLSLLITVYQDKIYWTNHGVHSANKENGSGHLVLQKNTGNEHIMDIIMFHKNVTQAHTECSVNNGGCSHLCLIAPLPQSHSCACPTGVLMKEDGKTCNDEMVNFLIFARRTDIRKISLDVPYYESVVMPLKELRNVIALDVDYQRGKVYWTDTVLDKIMRANLDGSQKEVVITHGLDTPDGLAIDTIGKKIYWTDTDLKRIEVSNMEGTIRKVLIWKNLDKPRAIALAYEYGYLYFSDWGKEPRIERTWMDGQKRQLIISKNLGWPNSLVIDKSTSMLIWADAKMKVIECARLDGSSRRILVDKVKHPYGLTVFENSIYWTDWQWLGIFKADKLTGNNQTLVLRGLSGLMDIHAVQMRDLGRETLINKCQKNNGGCSHLCLPNPKGISCACPTGLRMKEDNKTCQRVPEKFLLFASRGSIRRISMDTKDQTDVVLPLEGLHNVIAVDYDLREKKIYYTDVHLDVIKKANFDGSDSDIILMKDLVTTDGLAVDWIGRNIFWTDAGQDQIEVAWLNGMCRKTLIKENLDQPRAIALDPAHGLMFWTDWGDNPKIERANMDGGYRIVIANSGLGFPNGLSVDYIAERLYWVDAKLDKIETADFRGGNRVRLLENILHPFGLTVYGDHIYWTDWQTEQIERANKRTGKERKVIQRHLEGPMDIEVVANDRQIGKNACSYKNGGCSHLCLATPHGRSCECPDIEDERPCQRVPTTDSSGLIPEYNAGLDKCTEERSSLGLCERQSQSSSSGTHGAMIALGLGIVVLAVIVAIITWRVRKRRQMNAYRVDNEEFVSLNFANPTYQKTSTETINLDRASSTGSQEWKIFRFNKKDQQVSILPSHRNRDTSNSERAMLIHQVDSNSVAHSKHVADKHTSSLFRSKSSQDSPPPKVPYQHVKT